MRGINQYIKSLPSFFPEKKFSDEQLRLLTVFLNYFQRWNLKINLSSMKDTRGLFEKHILDSLAPYTANLPPFTGKMIDYGSGGGLPGIALSVMEPDLTLFSIDKVHKKVVFQELIQASLKLKNFIPLNTNLDHWKTTQDHNWFIARAVSSLPRLIKQADKFLKPKGYALFWKGEKWKEEWTPNPLSPTSTLILKEVIKYDFPGTNTGGSLLLFQKN